MDVNNMSFYPVGPNGEAIYFSTTGSSQATLTVASGIALPGALYQVIAYNPNGVASNPITFTVTNTLQAPAFSNPGPQTFVGGGSFSVIQTAPSSSIVWSILPPTGVTLSSGTDTGVTVNVSDGIAIPSPINYTLKATDSASQITTQVFTIQNTFVAPAFVNPGPQSFNNGGSFSVSQTAANTGQLTWSINPTNGMTLSSASKTGVTVNVNLATPISGVTYALTATNPTPTSCVQSFSVTNTVSSIYSFTTFTFTSIGANGWQGPTSLAGYGTSYPGYGTSYALSLGSGTSAGMQLWRVPATGNYQITIAGAGFAESVNTFKMYGAVFTHTLALTVSDVIRICVGQQSSSDAAIWEGGSGGTWVYNQTTSTLLLCAGGAGAGSTNTAGDGGQAGTSGTAGKGGGGAGGTAGNGGGAASSGNGGGGFLTNGANATGATPGGNTPIYSGWNGGLSFLNGALGGTGTNQAGGFGGGGCGGNTGAGSGGGGGYSGGGGANSQGAGGGGSYSINGAITLTAPGNLSTGYVTITKV